MPWSPGFPWSIDTTRIHVLQYYMQASVSLFTWAEQASKPSRPYALDALTLRLRRFGPRLYEILLCGRSRVVTIDRAGRIFVAFLRDRCSHACDREGHTDGMAACSIYSFFFFVNTQYLVQIT